MTFGFLDNLEQSYEFIFRMRTTQAAYTIFLPKIDLEYGQKSCIFEKRFPTSPMAKINPKIDLVFKKLFGSEDNTDILLSLVNAVLPHYQQIVELTLKNPYNLSDYLQGKLSILDIKAIDENGRHYDIEMQIQGSSFYGKRTLYYWAKMFGSQLDIAPSKLELDEKGNPKLGYSDLKKCIVISLMDFKLFGDERYHRCFTIKDRETNETHKTLDYLDLYFVELSKFTKELAFVKSALERWITFLNYAYQYSLNSLPEELSEIKEIRKASKRLEIMYLADEEKVHYESQQKFWLDAHSFMQEKFQELKKQAQQAEKQAQQAEKQAQEFEEAKKQAEEKTQQAEKQVQELKKQAQKFEEAKKQAEEKTQQAEEKFEQMKQELDQIKEKEQQQAEKLAQKLIAVYPHNQEVAELTGLTPEQVQKLRNK